MSETTNWLVLAKDLYKKDGSRYSGERARTAALIAIAHGLDSLITLPGTSVEDWPAFAKGLVQSLPTEEQRLQAERLCNEFTLDLAAILVPPIMD